MSVAVLIPYMPNGCAWRTAAHVWILDRYRREHPTWDVIVAGCDPPWSKGRAVTTARAQTDADVLVVADADSFVNSRRLGEAVARARVAPWVIPFETVRRLNSAVTQDLLSWSSEHPVAVPPIPDGRLDRPEYLGIRGGGIVVARADVYDAVPLDPRFEGWGGEDLSWGRALDTIVGQGDRLDGALWHLWHPPELAGKNPSFTGDADRLVRRYRAATGNVRMMRALIEDRMPDPHLHHDPAVRFRSLDGPRAVTIGTTTVRFADGTAEVVDGDVVDVLDRMAGITRA